MRTSGPDRRFPNRRLARFIRGLCRLVGVDSRRCVCIRCIAARSGIFRRTRTWVGHRAYADVHLLGIRVTRRFAYDLPMTAPPVSLPRVRSASGRRPRSLSLAGALGAHH